MWPSVEVTAQIASGAQSLRDTAREAIKAPHHVRTAPSLRTLPQWATVLNHRISSMERENVAHGGNLVFYRAPVALSGEYYGLETTSLWLSSDWGVESIFAPRKIYLDFASCGPGWNQSGLRWKSRWLTVEKFVAHRRSFQGLRWNTGWHKTLFIKYLQMLRQI
jgi:hypothetical protein